MTCALAQPSQQRRRHRLYKPLVRLTPPPAHTRARTNPACAPSSSGRSMMATSAPSAAKRAAMARPIPAPPPVTAATRSDKEAAGGSGTREAAAAQQGDTAASRRQAGGNVRGGIRPARGALYVQLSFSAARAAERTHCDPSGQPPRHLVHTRLQRPAAGHKSKNGAPVRA